ncbi:MAG: ABC transporter permease [Phycisphaerales bacterium]|nr:ABC transporter permease [Phycisphaerales bacterium]
MYQLQLTRRYLTSRLTPLLAVAAVALCVALVIVVVSVMTGFLNMVLASGRTLMGDVVISNPVRGFPHYDLLIETLEGDDRVLAATPVIDTFGSVRMPYPDGDSKDSANVQIWGIEPESFSAVTGYSDTLHWDSLPESAAPHVLRDALSTAGPEVANALDDESKVRLLRATAAEETNDKSDDELMTFVAATQHDGWEIRMRIVALDGPDALKAAVNPEAWQLIVEADPRLGSAAQVQREGLTLTRDGRAAMVMGLHVSKANDRGPDGETVIARDGWWWMPRFDVTVSMLPIAARGGFLEPENISLPVVNEFQSGVYLVDQTRVLMPLDVVQSLTHLDEADRVDPDDPLTVIGTDPARVTMVLVRGVEGVTPTELREITRELWRRFEHAAAALEGGTDVPILDLSPGLGIKTWEQQNASFIGPVEKEREMMRTLFSIIYLVCGALIVAIFWAIVYEKTRDIGILRSVGAPRSGIVTIFLLYGLVVGVLGSFTGLVLGWGITSNVNVIHDALAAPPQWPGFACIAAGIGLLALGVRIGRGRRLLPVLLGVYAFVACAAAGGGLLMLHAAGGIQIWDPSVYYFDTVPNTVDWNAALLTALAAVVVSVVAASIPAAHAADIDPVRALRYE